MLLEDYGEGEMMVWWQLKPLWEKADDFSPTLQENNF